MTNKKYSFSGEIRKIMVDGEEITLHQIVALRDLNPIMEVKEGTVGGWIQDESNLAQDGNAWVYPDAQVFGHGRVFGNAKVAGHATISGNAWVFGFAQVYGMVTDEAEVYGDAIILPSENVTGKEERA